MKISAFILMLLMSAAAFCAGLDIRPAGGSASAAGGNPFDQALNKSDTVQFAQVYVESSFLDAGGTPAIDTTQRQLDGASGSACLTWDEGSINANTVHITTSWFPASFFDGYSFTPAGIVPWYSSQVLVDIDGTALTAVDGTKSVNWDTRTLWDANTELGGALSVDWGNRKLTIGNGEAYALVDWGLQLLNDGAGNLSADWGNKKLYADDGASVSADWYNRLLTVGNMTSVDWAGRTLRDGGSGGVTVDWDNKELNDGSGGGLSWASYTLKNNGGSTSVDWGMCTLSAMGTTSVDWTMRSLNDEAGLLCVDWTGSRTLYGYNQSQSIKWGERTLVTSDGYSSLDWDNRLLCDPAGATVLDWENRELVSTAGHTVLNFSGDTVKLTRETTNGFVKTGNDDGSVTVQADGYTGDLTDSANHKIATVVNGLITAVNY